LDTDPDKFRSLATPYPPQPSGSPFPGDSSARPHSGTAEGCASGQSGNRPAGQEPFTPNQYLDAYGYSKLHQQGFKGQGMRIAVVEIDGFKRSDLETFGTCFGMNIPPTKVVPVGIKKPLPPGAETTLDLSVISAVAPKLKSIDVYEGGGAEVQLMLSVGEALGKPGAKPAAISISLGSCEPNLYRQMQFRRGLDNIFAVAAGAGISVLVAAGDNGVAGCSFDDNSKTLPVAAVGDPASSTYVTAVGGTNLVLNPQNGISQEFVWNDGSLGPFGGGGGFSILATKRPWYQQGTRRFRNYGLTRVVPDVAAVADSVPGYAIYCSATEAGSGCTPQGLPGGGWQGVGGTSAATPLTAAGLVLLAQKAKRAGKKPIGFANPLLYKFGKGKSAGSVFRDVFQGDNDTGAAIPVAQGGGSPLGCCDALKGYDAASGWGSIKATGLAKAAAKLSP
ncbi:MAG: S53 family peptidase, partial [Solirubrobacterales bacterium]